MSADSNADQDLPLLALLHRAARLSSEELVARLNSAGVAPVTPAHTTVLAHLGHDNPLSIAELARRAGVTRQTMHHAVTHLVKDGLLTSSPGPGFPRSTLIGLTVAGCQRRGIALEILRDLEAALGSELGPAALAQLRDSLNRGWPR